MTQYRGIHPPRNSTLAQKLAWFTRPSPDSDCLLWTGATSGTKKGGTHGVMRWDGRNQKAHRLAWIAANGPIGEGTKVLHRCDNPRCVNAAHLFLGTQADNIADMVAKRRQRGTPGVQHNRVKLTEEIVRRVREDKRSGTVIAAELNVTRQLVNMIRRRAIWKHLN